jgi:hypothetical protein
VFIHILNRYVFAASAMILLSASSLASGDDGSIDANGLAADPCPVVSRGRDLTDAEASVICKHLKDGSECDVLRLLGSPDSINRDICNHIRWKYQLGPGWLGVSFDNGRVVLVNHNERQTGVREDDFVGVIGP